MSNTNACPECGQDDCNWQCVKAIANSNAELVENPYAAIEDKADPSIPTATLLLYQHIGEYLTRKADTHVNRASSASLCYKRRWFQRNGVEGTPLTPRKLINFLLGDLAERTILYFIREALVGPGKLYSEVDFGEVLGSISFQGKELILYRQQDLVANIAGITVTAHADGWGKRNSDAQWELLEIKSASNYGFDDFKEIGPKDYLKQAHVNLQTDKAKTLNAKEVRFFYLRKETGHVYDRLFSFNPKLAKQIETEYQLALQIEEPRTPFAAKDETVRGKPTGRKILPFPCAGYCPFTSRCFPTSRIEWKKSWQGGFMQPVFLVSGGKE